MTIHAYAASESGGPFESFEYDPGTLQPEQVEIKVASCGVCHSDLSMLDNDWDMTQYPFVGGHEVVGRITEVGDQVKHVKSGDLVGLGWFSGSCMHCDHCIGGDHNLCAQGEGAIIGRHGGFADRVRCHWAWAHLIPEGLDPLKAGPLFCGGITVFNPIVQHALPPTARVGVIGIGGLGHMAVMFLNAWGCEVTAFSTSPEKEQEAHELGAHHFVNVKEEKALASQENTFDFILNTTNASLDWNAYVAALRPKGVLHTVGMVNNTFGVEPLFPLLMGQKSLAASPLGSPATVRDMIAFCARHDINPVTETHPMEKINDAFETLRNGSPRYRLVLTRDDA